MVLGFAWGLSAATLIGLLAVGIAGWYILRRRGVPEETPKVVEAPKKVERPPVRPEPVDTESLVELMVAQGRASLLLRPQVYANLNSDQRQRACDALRQSMGLVPEGEFRLGWCGKADVEDEDDDAPPIHVTAERYLMDRCTITNGLYFEFVAAGGYQQPSLWEAEAWYSVGDFVDQTGCYGPRYWRNGQYPPGDADKPVVGISWFEASAYARWAGKRLPYDFEWEKAGCWPIGGRQRRFPWGDSMDRERANVWGSGFDGVVAVDQFPTSASPGGMVQLIGNVWEWAADNYGQPPYGRPDVKLAIPMKSIRGGAFDSYFDSQATCQFQSGEVAAQRKHNIGFRCVVSVEELAVDPYESDRHTQRSRPAAQPARPEPAPVPATAGN